MKVAVGPAAYVAAFEPAVQSDATADLGLVPDSPGKIAQVYGAYVGAFIALLAGLMVILKRSSCDSAVGRIGNPSAGPGRTDYKSVLQ